ncbi:MAG: DegV family protein [Clostridia bacterium]
MQKFCIATDSGCDLAADFCRSRNLITYQMKYIVNDKEYTDTSEVSDIKRFYADMRSGAAPKTTQIPPYDLINFWKSLLPLDLPIVHLGIGSAISGTYSNAVAAREMFLAEHPGVQLYLIDSTLASLAYGMLLIKAADMRDDGKSAVECVDWIESHKALINAYFTTNDLVYLQRGGRLGLASAIVGSVLNINPILKLDDAGSIVIHDKTRGRKGAFKRICEIIERTCIAPQEQTLYVCHSDMDHDELVTIGDSLKERFGFTDVFYTFIGPIVGAHTGPGLYSVFFYGKPRT